MRGTKIAESRMLTITSKGSPNLYPRYAPNGCKNAVATPKSEGISAAPPCVSANSLIRIGKRGFNTPAYQSTVK